MSAIPTPDNFRLFGFATGSYMCHCHTCKVEFEGDKRAITCLPCALTRAETTARQDGSAERDGGAGVPVRSLSVHETDKSDRAEGVAALQQAGDHVAEVGKLIDLPTGPVAWARSTVIRDRDGYSIGSDEPEVHWGPTYPEDETDWFPLFALSQQPAEQIAENANCSPEPAAEPVAWRILDQFGTALALCALKPTDLIVGETLQPLYASPLPQQTALVDYKGLGPHEPAACGASAPSEPPRSDGGVA